MVDIIFAFSNEGAFITKNCVKERFCCHYIIDSIFFCGFLVFFSV